MDTRQEAKSIADLKFSHADHTPEHRHLKSAHAFKVTSCTTVTPFYFSALKFHDFISLFIANFVFTTLNLTKGATAFDQTSESESYDHFDLGLT